jgi:hypothetical protein
MTAKQMNDHERFPQDAPRKTIVTTLTAEESSVTIMNGRSNGSHSAADVHGVTPQSFPDENAPPPSPAPPSPAVALTAGKPRHSTRSYGVWWSLAGNVVVTMTTGLLFGSLYLEYFAKAFLLPQLDLMRFSEDDKGSD